MKRLLKELCVGGQRGDVAWRGILNSLFSLLLSSFFVSFSRSVLCTGTLMLFSSFSSFSSFFLYWGGADDLSLILKYKHLIGWRHKKNWSDQIRRRNEKGSTKCVLDPFPPCSFSFVCYPLPCPTSPPPPPNTKILHPLYKSCINNKKKRNGGWGEGNKGRIQWIWEIYSKT